MNDAQAQELQRLLTDMCRVQEQLVQVAQDKLAAMARLDTGRLEACTAEEYRLLAELDRLEERKRRWADGLDRPAGAPRLTRLSQAMAEAPEGMRDRLQALHAHLADWIGRMRRANWTVALTGRQCLDHFRSMIEILTRGTEAVPVYSARGAVPPASGGCLIDDVA